jgi:hypothetical protein
MLDVVADTMLFDARQLAVQAGPLLACAVAMTIAVIHRRQRADDRASRAEATNEALRDEVWRLKEAAAARDRDDES